ncbi:hypothetical protein [Actinomadura sp. CNU-125]|uniref:hypothetical protein n=1 Tax=Actinomadura sp. CNU-125 TaxID=1904961 RepID=UPI00130128B7|nr:hypothetical protein [Actinomadura sp. CNU-125]
MNTAPTAPAPARQPSTSTRPPTHCPVHPECALEGGPIRWRCAYGHAVPAADINREVTR